MCFGRNFVRQRLRSEKREFFIENLVIPIHCIIVMIWWPGLAPWEFEFSVPGSLTFTFLVPDPNDLYGEPDFTQAELEHARDLIV